MKAELIRKRGQATVVRIEMLADEIQAAAQKLTDSQELLAGVDRLAEAVKAELFGRWFDAEVNEVRVCCAKLPKDLVDRISAEVLAWAWEDERKKRRAEALANAGDEKILGLRRGRGKMTGKRASKPAGKRRGPDWSNWTGELTCRDCGAAFLARHPRAGVCPACKQNRAVAVNGPPGPAAGGNPKEAADGSP